MMSFVNQFLSICMDIDKNLKRCSLQTERMHYVIPRYLIIISTSELLLKEKKNTKNIFKNKIGNKRMKRLKRWK